MNDFVLHLGWRLTHRPSGRFIGLPVLVAVAALAAAYVYLGQQSLTGPERRADRLGTYSASAFRLDVEIPPGDSVTTRAAAALRARNVDVALAVVAPDFPLSGIVADGVYYRELPWGEGRLNGSIRILDGRFPQAPGEVALLGRDLISGVAVGDLVDAPGAPDSLRVVGVGESTLQEREELLAAAGTWASLPAHMRAPDGLGIDAGIGLYVRDGNPVGTVKQAAGVIARVLRGHYDGDPRRFAAGWMDTLTTADGLDHQPEELWVSRSPLSFWAPCLLLLPLLLLASHVAAGRRLITAVRTAVRTGVPRRSAVTAVWAGVHLQLLGWGILGLAAGVVAGWLAARTGVAGSRWLGWRSPVPLLAGLAGGWILGSLLALEYWLQRTRAATQHVGEGVGRAWIRHLRHVVAMVSAAAAVIGLREVSGPGAALRTVLLMGATAALMSPELIGLAAAAMMRGGPSPRLSGRLLLAHRARGALLLACVTLLFAVSTGFLTALSSFVQTEREKVIPAAPRGIVALDNDDSPALPVPPYVRASAESVPSLARQEPVQMWATGRLETDTTGQVVDVEHAAGTSDLPGISFAVATASDAAVVLGRALTRVEEAALEDSRVLVVSDGVSLRSGTVNLIDITDGSSIARVPASRAAPATAPWLVSTPTLMLVSTARALDLPMTRGALLYTHVSTADAQRVLDALNDAGINPEQAAVHHAAPSLLPPPALVASAAVLSFLLISVLTLMVRAQLVSMRPWASRLQQLGLSWSWTRRVFAREYAVITAVGVLLGVGCGYIPIAAMSLSAPDVPTPFPAVETLTLTATLLLTMAAVVYLGMRQLTADESVNSRET